MQKVRQTHGPRGGPIVRPGPPDGTGAPTAPEVPPGRMSGPETRLAEREAHLRLIIESEPECVKLLDADGRLLEMNPAGLAMVEAESLSQVIGARAVDLVVPEHQAAFRALTDRVIQGATGSLEFEMVGLKGSRRWLDMHAAPLRDARGRVITVLSITRDITEQKRAENALRSTRERLRFLMSSTPCVLYACAPRPPYEITFISDNVREQLGYEAEAFTADPFWLERVHPDDLDGLVRSLESGLERGRFAHEYRFRHADGSYRWMRDDLRLIEAAGGSPREMVGYWIDITDRRNAEEGLAERLRQQAAIADARRLALTTGDLDVLFRHAVDLVARTLDVGACSILELPGECQKPRHPVGVDPGPAPAAATTEGSGGMGTLIAGAGRPFGVLEVRSTRPREFGRHDVQFLEAIANLLAGAVRRHRAEAAMRESEARLNLAVTGAGMGTWDADLKTGRGVWSETCFRMLGYAPTPDGLGTEEMWMRRVHPDDLSRVAAEWSRARGERSLFAPEYRIIRAGDGAMRWLADFGRCIYDASGHAVRYVGVIFDITERRRSQEAHQELLRRLAYAEEQERSRLARDLHDRVGQSLAALRLTGKMLEAALHAVPEAREHLVQLAGIVDRLDEETHRLARELRPTALEDLGLLATLKAHVEEWSSGARIPVDMQTVGMDRERLPPDLETTLYRVLQEALTNVAGHAAAGRVSVILKRSLEDVLLIVEDDGRGFDPQAALDPAGTRLGLRGMRERVALFGGTLEIESSPGGGSTLFARVPLQTSLAAGAERRLD